MSVRGSAQVTTHHSFWDRDLEPVLAVMSGTTVEFVMSDPSGGQLSPTSTAADLAELDLASIPPIYGPVYVDGAEPGDALQVKVVNLKIGDWGWTAVFPGFGLLEDEFPEPALHIWQLDAANLTPAEFAPGIKVPLHPFLGVMGVAPGEAGRHAVINPRHVGGNLDVRDLTVGSTLLLPVEVPGALFSCGDGHAAQGDGEVCGSALETPVTATLRFDVIKQANLRMPRFVSQSPAIKRHLEHGYDVTCGVDADLMTAARIAVGDMVDSLAAQTGMTRLDAYILCSVCGDLRISEIVDAPHWVVSFYLPRAVFV